MRKIIAPAGVLIAGACTTAMNWRFSFQLGANVFDSYTWAIFSVALDVTKWFMLPCAALAWNAHKPRAIAAITIWIVATIYSFTAALGFAALNRDMTRSARHQQIEIKKTLETMQHSPRWQSSAACADATSTQSKEFCTNYRALADRIQSTPGDADPQSAMLAELFGLKAETVRLVLAVFLATACEVISALGFFALLSPTQVAERRPSKPWTPPTRSDHVVTGRAATRHDGVERDAPRPTQTWKSPR